MDINKEQKLHLKIDAIYNILKNLPDTTHIGILGGETGRALFLFYYSQLRNNDEAFEKGLQLLLKSAAIIKRETDISPILSMGITSIGWLISHIEKAKICHTGSRKLLDKIDNLVLPKALNMLTNGEYDYLHGALGIGNYLLNRRRTKHNVRKLSSLIKKLKGLATFDGENVKWHDFDIVTKKQNQQEYNWGLSHGIPSILMFLINCYEEDIERATVLPLIIGTVNFTLASKQDPLTDGSCFGYKTSDHPAPPVKTRLAWCYGDIGVIYSLVRANQILESVEVDRYLMSISKFQTSRREPKENEVFDAGFCHGASGVAHIFSKIFKLTGNEDYHIAADHWYDVMLAMDIFEDGLAGYKTFKIIPKPSFINDTSVIEGIAGIGLVMISAVSNVEYRWDELFLLR